MVDAIGGSRRWLWRAMDSEGDALDLLVRSGRDKEAAWLLMRKLLQQVRRQERKMQGFKPPGSGQRCPSTHACVHNTVNIERHLAPRRPRRLFKKEEAQAWRNATVAA